MGGSVSELVRMQWGIPAAAQRRLSICATRWRFATFRTEPQGCAMRLRMALSQTEISVKSGTVFDPYGADRGRFPLPTTLMTSASKMNPPPARSLSRRGDSRVDKESQNRHVAPALEVCAFADLKQFLRSLSVTIARARRGCSAASSGPSANRSTPLRLPGRGRTAATPGAVLRGRWLPSS